METYLPPTGFVLAAVMAWGFYVNGMHRIGNTGLVLSLVGLWLLAVVDSPQRGNHQPLIIHRQPSTVHDAPLTVRAAFVASTLERAKKVYHKADCQYVRLLEHRTEFSSEDAAREAGYVPCTRCVSTAVSLTTPPVR